MYILLALIAACALGIAVHFLLPDRDLRGAALVPGIATALAALVYTGLQWAGIAETSVWLWLASIVGSVVVAGVLGAVITASRRRSDAEQKAALGI